ncbi:NUDIX domain-containing protein [Gordonia sp. VNK21]|uniref:NUDIX domain-containing protein n=1 Tax=Gordonia sp. VNK21 TaxID=3382483 RepID=UPI0038D4E357
MSGPGSHAFTVTGSETVYDGAIVALRRDQVTMPGGRTAEREVVEHLSAVVVLARDAQGRIAVINQYRHPVGRRLLELPAGLLDGGPGESPLAGAQRELAEEAGLAARRWHTLADLLSSPGFTDEALRVYLAEDLTEVPRSEVADEEADLTIDWLDPADAVAAVLAGEIVNASAAAGILALYAAEQSGAPLRSADAPWRDRSTRFAARRESGEHP